MNAEKLERIKLCLEILILVQKANLTEAEVKQIVHIAKIYLDAELPPDESSWSQNNSPGRRP